MIIRVRFKYNFRGLNDGLNDWYLSSKWDDVKHQFDTMIKFGMTS